MKRFTSPLAVFPVLSILIRATFAVDATFEETAVNGTTIAVVCVDPKQIEFSPKLMSLLENGAAGTPQDMVPVVKKSLSEKGYFALDLPYSMRAQARLLTSSKIPEANFVTLTKVWPKAVGRPTIADGWRMVSLSSKEDALSTPTIPADWIAPEYSAWKTAVEATTNFPVQIVVVPPRYFRETIVELDSKMPEVFGGGSAKTLLSDVDWVSLGLDPKSLELEVIIQAASAQSAQKIKSHLPKLLSAFAEEASLDQASSFMLQAVLDLMKPRVQESQLILSLQGEQADALLQTAALIVNAAAQPFADSQTQTKFRQLALGVHNYYASYKHLPTYYQMERSKGLSWRVHILPFVEQADLYKEFHLDEAWDSPHNLRLLDRMPEIFKPVVPPGSKETVKPNHTTYVAPIGKATVFGQDKAVGLEHITDGTSNTVMFVEVKPEHAIPWTSPEEYRFDPANPAARLRIIREHVTIATMDGAVHQVRADQPNSFWSAVFSRNGSEVVTFE
jgi:Protein of unknown function (DUF1559)